MSLARTLWQANADWAAKILAHPFVQGLGDGSLATASFITGVELSVDGGRASF